MQHIKNSNFVSVFIKNFLSQYSYEKLKKNHCLPPTGYLWNACEKKFVKSLVGSEANDYFDRIEKDDAICIQYDIDGWGDEEAAELPDSLNSSKKIQNSGLYEFYVIARNFEWCYIVTHEGNNCGPYFIINNAIKE